jgi:FSR family fosmidomycin resistance protein-like MFS transporter
MSSLRTQGVHGLSALLGAVHAAVDLFCVVAVLRALHAQDVDAARTYFVVLGYDLVAFAFQLPLGLLVDRLGALRGAYLTGVVLSGIALCCTALHPTFVMALAAMGNALFHVGAGGTVLANGRGRAAPAGVFVAPGSLGLGLGLWLGPRTDAPLWPLVLLAVGVLVLTARLRVRASPDPPALGVQPQPVRQARALWLATLCLLLFSVAIRGFVESSGCHGCPKLPLLGVAVPVVGFAAKILGGFAADRLGWKETSVAALLISAPLIAFSGSSIACALGGLLLFQMTMPVTLTAVFLLLPRKPATAFGFPCVGLIAGVFAASRPWGQELLGPSALLGIIAASAMAILSALELMGIRRERPTPVSGS